MGRLVLYLMMWLLVAFVAVFGITAVIPWQAGSTGNDWCRLALAIALITGFVFGLVGQSRRSEPSKLRRYEKRIFASVLVCQPFSPLSPHLVKDFLMLPIGAAVIMVGVGLGQLSAFGWDLVASSDFRWR